MCDSAFFIKNTKTGGKSKMKKEVSKLVLKVVEKIVKNEVDTNVYAWPTICMGFTHQPKRPKVHTRK